MVRRLEKIEKEMGYCEIKLEKQRRLRKQRDFLMAELEAIGRFLTLYASFDTGLGSLPYAKVAKQLALERARSDKPGRFHHRAKEDFVAAGVLQMMGEDREILEREQRGIESKLENFQGFTKKRTVLEEERKLALSSLAPPHSSKVRKINEAFQRIEGQWNSLSEDSLNLDEGIFFLARNTDYIKSARAFLITAKGNFDIEGWVESGYSNDLFRHSNIGRAKEMLDGANRNLKLAQMELCCVGHLKFELEPFEPTLVAFLHGLFDDIFIEGRLARSITIAEEAFARSEKVVQKVRQRREVLHGKLERVEAERTDLFSRMGGDSHRRLAAQ